MGWYKICIWDINSTELQPKLASETDTSYFDTEFTREAVKLTPPPVRAGPLDTVDELDEMQNNFVQFSFHGGNRPSFIREQQALQHQTGGSGGNGNNVANTSSGGGGGAGEGMEME